MLYKIYFPHVATLGEWETEIALTNTSEVAVRGQLQAYTADGILLSQSIPLVLPPLGRREVVVGTSFQNPEDIAYVAFIGDSGFLAGYTRFWQPGGRVSLAAAGTGTKRGWYTKIEDDGYTGIAFVNVDIGDATVELIALDANGGQVATATVKLRPGQKYASLVNQLFPVDLTNARYFKFESDKNLLSFTVSGSDDGQMLDGLHCLGDYIR
jgi:hypothetical protein